MRCETGSAWDRLDRRKEPNKARVGAARSHFRCATLFLVVQPQGAANHGFVEICPFDFPGWARVHIDFVSFESVLVIMLHCNMKTALNLQLGLEDLLADMRHSRKNGDLGRLAFIAYCDVRRWARTAGEVELAERSSRVITDSPHDSREAFLTYIDDLIHALELRRFDFATTTPADLDCRVGTS